MASKLTKFEKASKLADMWMDGVSELAPDQTQVEFVGRTGRAGLGIKTMPIGRRTSPADPVEKKLERKLNAVKENYTKNYEKRNPNEVNEFSGSDEDDEPESRVKAFTKRRAHSAAPPQHCAKKVK